MTLDKLQNTKIHTYIIEEIRRKIIEMTKRSSEITLCWIKAHGNELADTQAKKATSNESLTEDCNRIPKSVLTR